MARLPFTRGRLSWRLLALTGWIALLVTVYLLHPSSTSFKQSISTVLRSRPKELCSPRTWSAGQWKPTTPRTTKRITRPNDVLPYYGFEGCASDREYNWQLAADEDQWNRFPDVASYVWTPPKECDVLPLERDALVRDLVERGGWLLVGGEFLCHCVVTISLSFSFRLPILRIGACFLLSRSSGRASPPPDESQILDAGVRRQSNRLSTKTFTLSGPVRLPLSPWGYII